MSERPVHLRLLWPQWQGAGTNSITEFSEGFPLRVARRGYSVGSRVLQAVVAPHSGPCEVVPTDMSDRGLAEKDGIEAKDVVVEQLRAALEIIGRYAPGRITTLGGDCSVSVAPFTTLAETYKDDLAVVWIDSHPDTDTGDTSYGGYHAMAVSTITGHGDHDVVAELPATVPASRVALAGLHSWVDDAYSHLREWGITAFGPEDLRRDSAPLLAWIRDTGATKVAIHLDVDTVDAAEVRFGLGEDFGGLSIDETRAVVADIASLVEVVGFTVAEYTPRQVMRLQQLLDGMPL